jgi:hypothetical protein
MDWSPRLTTANRFASVEKPVEELSRKLAARAGILGVLATGGYARGFLDSFSDVDLLVFGEKPGIDDLGWELVEGMVRKGLLGELPEFARSGVVDVNDAQVWSFLKFQASPNRTLKLLRDSSLDGIAFDLELLDVSEVRPGGRSWHWLTEYRWMLGHAKLLAHDGKGTVARLVAEAARYPDEERKSDLRERRERASVLLTMAETLAGRGDLFSARRMAGQALEAVIDGAYSRAGLVVPYDKWKYHYVARLPGVPADLGRRLAALCEEPPDPAEGREAIVALRARIEGIRTLKREVLPK